MKSLRIQIAGCAEGQLPQWWQYFCPVISHRCTSGDISGRMELRLNVRLALVGIERQLRVNLCLPEIHLKSLRDT